MKDDLRTTRRQCRSSQIVPSQAAVGESVPQSYPAVLTGLKKRVRSARRQATLSVNRKLISLFCSTGREIPLHQPYEGWDTRVIDRRVADLRRAFPEMMGLSAGSLRYMRTFVAVW